MNLLRCWLCVLLGCAWLAPAPTPAWAAERSGERVALIVAGLDKQIYLPVRLAAHLGYFREQGLDVDLLTEPSGANAEDVLLVGAAQGVVGAYHHTLDLQSRGKAVQSVIVFTLSPGEVELVASRHAGVINSPADWKGRRLGVTGLSSATHVLTHALAQRHGLKPQDYTVLPVGSGAAFVTALRQGRIDAGMSTEPVASSLIQSGEARLLHELCANLIDNALRYTPPGGAVTLRLRRAPGQVLLEVEDNGPGIPPGLREQVFERFFRLDNRQSDGCGLGLAIVREIAQAHRASVQLGDGPEGRGLRVTVAFAAGASVAGRPPA